MLHTLIQFAGDDRPPRPRPYRQPLPVHSLFRFGHDTADIASILGCSEPEALKQLSIERSRHLNLPNPYGVASCS
jgi:hypothetical protein